MRCKKCGRLLPEENYKSCECSVCLVKRKNKAFSFCCVVAVTAVLFLFIWATIEINRACPVSYEDVTATVVDKQTKSIPISTGKSVVITRKYYLTLDDGEELRVPPSVYRKVNVKDCITVTNRIRNGHVLGRAYKQ